MDQLDLIPKTWKYCNNAKIRQIRDEVWDEATRLGYTKGMEKPIIWTFKSAYRWGEARYHTSSPTGTIGIERIFLKAPDAARETIIHEMAHLFTKGEHHSEKWKKVGNELGKLYNISMSRCDDSDEIGIDANLLDYHVKCKHCGKIYHWPEQTRSWKFPERFSCGYCGGALERYEMNKNS